MTRKKIKREISFEERKLKGLFRSKKRKFKGTWVPSLQDRKKKIKLGFSFLQERKKLNGDFPSTLKIENLNLLLIFRNTDS